MRLASRTDGITPYHTTHTPTHTLTTRCTSWESYFSTSSQGRRHRVPHGFSLLSLFHPPIGGFMMMFENRLKTWLYNSDMITYSPRQNTQNTGTVHPPVYKTPTTDCCCIFPSKHEYTWTANQPSGLCEPGRCAQPAHVVYVPKGVWIRHTRIPWLHGRHVHTLIFNEVKTVGTFSRLKPLFQLPPATKKGNPCSATQASMQLLTACHGMWWGRHFLRKGGLSHFSSTPNSCTFVTIYCP